MGITFDIHAMRSAYPGTRPARFQAIAAVADDRELTSDSVLQEADIWVIVDGRLKLGRRNVRPKDGSISVDIELGPEDRFLTLATTWDGNVRNYDWVVFGDPVLELTPMASP
jgi:hypothetical protein